MRKEILIYQSKSGKIEFRGDLKKDTIWGTQKMIAKLFNVEVNTINYHIKEIFKTRELKKKSTIRKIRIVQKEGKREVSRETEFYNLDAIISVGYRVNSTQATRFRIWATKTLKQHLLEGYTINKKQLIKNYQKFQASLKDIKTLLPEDKSISAQEALELVSAFAGTWGSLEAYDKENFPKSGWTKKQVKWTAEDLKQALAKLKQDLLDKKQADCQQASHQRL